MAAKFPNLTCYVCSRQKVLFLAAKNGYEIHRCSDCGHAWVSSPVSQKNIDDFYASDDSKKMQHEFPERVVRKNAKRFLEYMKPIAPQKGTLVDAGCGRGIFLEEAQNFGWRSIGIENSVELRQECETRRVSVCESWNAIEKQYGSHFADRVTLWEVLEHFPDPMETLLQIKSFLKPAGILALSTPNFGGSLAHRDPKNWHELRPPMHLHYFTPQSLKTLLEKAGFSVLRLMSYGSWSPRVDQIGDFFQKHFRLSKEKMFLLKVACYKAAKPYFDRTLQRKVQGLGLFCIASPSKQSSIEFKEFF